MHEQRTPPRPLPPEQLSLGRAVRLRRAYSGISQEELGFRSSLHRNYIGAIERGEINPTLGTLRKLAYGLGLAVSELMKLCEHFAERRG